MFDSAQSAAEGLTDLLVGGHAVVGDEARAGGDSYGAAFCPLPTSFTI